MINREIENYVPAWSKLLKISEMGVCVHTFNVLYLIINNAEYSKMTPRDQNILKWVALLHDICKLGLPVFHGKDHIHPFKGAREVLQLFKHHGTITISS